MSLVLLLACARAQSEPLQEAVQSRSDAYGVYANEYARGYEPMAFAAIPLHAPLPIIHIVSSAPLNRYQSTQSRRSPYNAPTSYSNHVSSFVHAPSTSHHVSSFVQSPSTLATSHAHQTHYRQNTYPQTLQPYQPPYAQQMPYYPPPLYRQPNIYAASMPYGMNADLPDIEDDAPTILYARPQPHGGYTYHKKPSKKRIPPKKKEPVIIRVHKYRVVKGR
ncbi:uncharacterized protein LOC106135670 [Amyelois transitella]|uniref:uncharacterized protein LOC106135670 n=1 Tax=Amyelois transitella TaxID=680683 RepID=UPI00067BD563|nr:uncharacterized protein LOC106135670 [Amyelois transitella]